MSKILVSVKRRAEEDLPFSNQAANVFSYLQEMKPSYNEEFIPNVQHILSELGITHEEYSKTLDDLESMGLIENIHQHGGVLVE